MRDKIIKDFQSSFCDQWIETIKLMSANAQELNRRIKMDFDKINESEKNVYILLGHQFNWEWCNALANQKSSKQFAGIYLRVKNKSFDRLMHYIRSRFGSILIAAHNFTAQLKSLHKNPFVLGMIADQSPGNKVTSLWYDFLNRPARFAVGPQKIIGKKDACVYFANIIKEKRGYYSVKFISITDNAALEDKNLITDEFVRLLQNAIKAQPYNWLWSHKRWKYDMKENEHPRILNP